MNHLNAEVETHVAVNPTNARNVVAYWQQDRWGTTAARTATSPGTRSTVG